MTTNLTPGTTIRITRTTPQGTTKFIKTGTVGTTIRPDYIEFTENLNSPHPGLRAYVTTDRAVTRYMKGWTQHTEILPT